MSDRDGSENNKGRKVYSKISPKEQVEEIYVECPGCGKQYLLQEEETRQFSLTCDRCGLIIIL
jgi:predicted RNA-binding Zn-ribbon protein involved in translation (DUF1610 family)